MAAVYAAMAHTSANSALACLETPTLQINAETSANQVGDVLFGSVVPF